MGYPSLRANAVSAAISSIRKATAAMPFCIKNGLVALCGCLIVTSAPQKKKKPQMRFLSRRGCAYTPVMVEIRGFEPLTYTLRTYRATNCAISPCNDYVEYYSIIRNKSKRFERGFAKNFYIKENSTRRFFRPNSLPLKPK